MPQQEQKTVEPGNDHDQRPEAFGRGEVTQDGKPNQENKPEGQKQPVKKPFWKRPVLLSVMIAVVLVGDRLWHILYNSPVTFRKHR